MKRKVQFFWMKRQYYAINSIGIKGMIYKL